jgi:hypothetical protein
MAELKLNIFKVMKRDERTEAGSFQQEMENFFDTISAIDRFLN